MTPRKEAAFSNLSRISGFLSMESIEEVSMIHMYEGKSDKHFSVVGKKNKKQS